MKKFCTNCGHENDAANQACVECGQSLSGERQPAAVTKTIKDKKPLSLKAKILSVVSILLIASLAGVYSWGTKTASADTAVSKFFEALQNEDAEGLAKQVRLSNGQTMTTKEAEAFIDEYRDISPYELEDVAQVEKNGKVIGLFDAHRVIIPVQQLSFNFPHDGLVLSLNGETVKESKNQDDEYVFKGVTPGLHEAEFIYEGEFTEFTYPFDLSVELNRASSDPQAIYEDLPVSSVVFELERIVEGNPNASQVIIGDKKIPVDAAGVTDDVGPLLLDGSISAQAEVDFPWGKQLSEPVDITSGYQTISFSGLDEKQQESLTNQLTIFAEEYVQAFAMRDATVFTTVTKDQLGVFKEDIEWMKNNGDYFMGALTQVGIDEESISILQDGKTIAIDVQIQIDGDHYYESETPTAEDITNEVVINFVYDKENEKWMLSSYNENMWLFDVAPTATFEGSKKMHKSKGPSKTVVEEDIEEDTEEDTQEDAGGGFITDETVEWFMSDYNDASVASINDGDYTFVSQFVLGSSPRAGEQAKFVESMHAKGVTEEHLDTKLESIKPLGRNFYEVTTIETFIIHGTENSSEKTYRTVTKIKDEPDSLYVYELISTTEI